MPARQKKTLSPFGVLLRSLLKAKHWSVPKLAEESGVSHPTIYQSIYGDAQPSSDTLTKLAEALGASSVDLMHAAGHMGDKDIPLGFNAEEQQLIMKLRRISNSRHNLAVRAVHGILDGFLDDAK